MLTQTGTLSAVAGVRGKCLDIGKRRAVVLNRASYELYALLPSDLGLTSEKNIIGTAWRIQVFASLPLLPGRLYEYATNDPRLAAQGTVIMVIT